MPQNGALQPFQLLKHRLKPRVVDSLAEVWHLAPVGFYHFLVMSGGVAGVGKAVAEFYKCCQLIFAYALVIFVVGAFGAGAAFFVCQGVNHLGNVGAALFFHVVVSLASVFNGVVRPASGKRSVNFFFFKKIGKLATKVVHHFQMYGVRVAVVDVVGANMAFRRILHGVPYGVGVKTRIQFAINLHKTYPM